MGRRRIKHVDVIIIIDGKVHYQGKAIFKENAHASPWSRTVNGRKYPAQALIISLNKEINNKMYDVILIPKN